MTIRMFRMKPRSRTGKSLVAVLCALSLASGDALVYAQQQGTSQDSSAEQAAPPIPADQLDSLVAPIALYPDPLLSQVLVASTYPLEVIQLQQWMAKHKDLKGDALTTAVQKENWDPSIQAMVALPDAVKQLAENIKWTTDLGNAFLAQQADVMDAVQRMRKKAQKAGNLKSTEQQKVETQTVENKTVLVIQQSNPQVVYVPSYNPVVVYGPPVYPYPPIVYPPASYYAGAAIAFGVGIAIGAAYRGGWGYGCGWGNNNVNINVNNNYVSHYNKTNINNGNRNTVNGGNRVNNRPAGGNNTWQHNPQHRGGAPYSNRATANQYGGTARGDSASNRQANARQQPSTNNRGTNAGNRASTNDRGANAGNRAGNGDGARPSNTGENRGGGGGNNIGNRQGPSSSGSRNTSAFGGASSRSSAQASSSRGKSSMGGSRGGGGGGRRR
jgi:uncharacterized membrane protein YgcG